MTTHTGKPESVSTRDTAGTALLSLADLGTGQTGIVRRVEGGRGLIHRLAELGLLPGTPVRVVRGGGPVILDVRGHKLLLGRGMVSHVRVDVCGANADASGAST